MFHWCACPVARSLSELEVTTLADMWETSLGMALPKLKLLWKRGVVRYSAQYAYVFMCSQVPVCIACILLCDIYMFTVIWNLHFSGIHSHVTCWYEHGLSGWFVRHVHLRISVVFSIMLNELHFYRPSDPTTSRAYFQVVLASDVLASLMAQMLFSTWVR